MKLSTSDIHLLEKELFLLKEKTGIYIDPYGTTRLYPDHGKILLNAIEHRKNVKNIISLMKIIQDFIEKDEVLIFEGD